jgi:hypothetical protein
MEEGRESQRPHGAPAENEGGAPALGALDPEEMARAAAEVARENPHAALAGAFAIGFLLGGGLTPRLLVSLAVLAGRRYAADAAREALGEAVRRQIDEIITH